MSDTFDARFNIKTAAELVYHLSKATSVHLRVQVSSDAMMDFPISKNDAIRDISASFGPNTDIMANVCVEGYSKYIVSIGERIAI